MLFNLGTWISRILTEQESSGGGTESRLLLADGLSHLLLANTTNKLMRP